MFKKCSGTGVMKDLFKTQSLQFRLFPFKVIPWSLIHFSILLCHTCMHSWKDSSCILYSSVVTAFLMSTTNASMSRYPQASWYWTRLIRESHHWWRVKLYFFVSFRHQLFLISLECPVICLVSSSISRCVCDGWCAVLDSLTQQLWSIFRNALLSHHYYYFQRPQRVQARFLRGCSSYQSYSNLVHWLLEP